jgi:hypothetical protein
VCVDDVMLSDDPGKGGISGNTQIFFQTIGVDRYYPQSHCSSGPYHHVLLLGVTMQLGKKVAAADLSTFDAIVLATGDI